MATKSRLSILFLLTVGTAAISFFSVKKVVSAQGRVALTATRRQSVYDRTGTAHLVETAVYAIRGDGSTVRAWSVAKPGNGGTGTAMERRIIDLSSAEEVSIDGLTDSTTTAPIPKQALNFYRTPPKCTTDIAPMRGNMLGYEVVRNVEDRQTSTRLIRTEEWRAPALDCLVLKETIFFGRTQADLYTSNINEVLEVKIGEPSPALFERPTEYTERAPSQQSAEYARRYPAAVCPACSKGDQEADEAYYRRRAKSN